MYNQYLMIESMKMDMPKICKLKDVYERKS